MASLEPFTLVEREERQGEHRLINDLLHLSSATRADQDLQCLYALRRGNEGMIVTSIPAGNVPLRTFAAAGFATCELDLETDSFASFRGFTGPNQGRREGALAESVHFAKYRYHWAGEDFVLYTVDSYQYVLKERRNDEDILGPSKVTDALIVAIGSWMIEGIVWVFDGYWYQDKNLYRQVQKMSWDKVILDEAVKKELTAAAGKFFDSKDVYDDLGVPWKRGLLWHGPPGNGKTVSIKALMHTLLDRKYPIPTLYVKNAPQPYHIQSVFTQARQLAPCMLVLEDIETIVTPVTRSYFFNQMDGLEDNSGMFVVATTNFLDKLDPGLTKRPSRFDRKYLFPIPNQHERYLYCQFWQVKLAKKPEIEFPDKVAEAMASITHSFSFAYLQECFVATLLIMAQDDEEEKDEKPEKDLNDYPLWVEFRKQAMILRKQIEESSDVTTAGSDQQHAVNPPRRMSAKHMGQTRTDMLESRPGHGDPLTQALPSLSIRDDEHLPALGWRKNLTFNPFVFEKR